MISNSWRKCCQGLVAYGPLAASRHHSGVLRGKPAGADRPNAKACPFRFERATLPGRSGEALNPKRE